MDSQPSKRASLAVIAVVALIILAGMGWWLANSRTGGDPTVGAISAGESHPADSRPNPKVPIAEASSPRPAAAPTRSAVGTVAENTSSIAQPGDFLLSGRVLKDGTLEPIAGAEVVVRPVALIEDPSGRAAGSAMTNADGSYRLVVSGDGAEALAFSARVTAKASGFAARSIRLGSLEKAGKLSMVDFLLSPAGLVAGRVVDSDGKGIPRAALAIYRSTRGTPPGTPSEAIQLLGDDDGSFRSDAVSATGPLFILAVADGYARNFLEGIEPGNEKIEIVLQHASASVSGKVLSSDGTPSAWATIGGRWRDPKEGTPATAMAYSTRANAAGEFALKSLPAGSWTFMATAEEGMASADATLAADKNVELVLALPSRVAIRGRFVDNVTGVGVPGIAVQDPASRTRRILSDHEGRFTVRIAEKSADGSMETCFFDVTPPWIVASINHDGLGPYDITNSYIAFYSAKAASASEIAIPLKKGSPFRGICVDEAGKPVAGANVTMSSIPDDWDQALASAEDGTFSGALPANSGLRILASTEELGCIVTFTAAEVSGPEPFKVVMRRSARASGRVLTPTGEVVAGAAVVASSAERNLGPIDMQRTTSDANGYYFVEVNGELEYQLIAEPPKGWEFRTSKARIVSMVNGKIQEGIDLVLAEGGAIEGTVIDRESRQPIEGAQVSLTVASPAGYADQREVLTDAEGRFRLGGIGMDDPIQFASAKAAGYGSVTLMGRQLKSLESSSGIQIELEREEQVAVVARDAGTGQPVARFRWAIRRTDVPDAWRFSPPVESPIGEFVVPALKSLVYEVLVQEVHSTNDQRSGRVGKAKIDSLSHQKQPVVVAMKAEATLRGVVRYAKSREPAPGAVVIALSDALPPEALRNRGAEWPEATGTTDGAGNFVITGLAEGSYRLSATHNLARTREPIQVLASGGRTESVELMLSEGGRIFGVVRGTDGAPAAGVEVHANSSHADSAVTVTAADGTYSLSGVHPGSYAMSVIIDGILANIGIVLEMTDHDEEQDLDLTGWTRMSGNISVNGLPPSDVDPASITVMRDGGSVAYLYAQSGSTNYKALIPRGRYTLKGRVGRATFPIADPLVSEGVDVVRDFNLIGVPADVAVDVAEDVSMVGTNLLIAAPGASTASAINWSKAVFNGQMGARYLHLEAIPAGTWEASLFRNGKLLGVSGPTAIGPGLENAFVIPLSGAAPAE